MKAPILTGFLVVLSAATVDLENLGEDLVRAPRSLTVAKTVRSSNLRLVFWVGLEGSGHHTIVESFDKSFSTHTGHHPHRSQCVIRADPYYVIQAMTASPSHYADAIRRARNDMRALAQSESEVSSPGAVETLCGRWSYPSDTGPEKVFQYLDVGVMAELAEDEGVDFRIIYLRRRAKDILISTTVHRDFDRLLGRPASDSRAKSFMEYARILLTDIAVMHSFLSGLDPAFIVCHDMEYAGDIQQASAIADFVSTNEQMGEALVSSLLELSPPKHSTTEGESLPIKDADVVVRRLQRTLDIFEPTYCRTRT